jgi:hypothetical protein
MTMMKYLAWAMLAIGLACLAMGGTARTLLWLGEWNGRPLGDRYIDWIEERAHSPREAKLFRLFWLSGAVGALAILLSVVLLSRL